MDCDCWHVTVIFFHVPKHYKDPDKITAYKRNIWCVLFKQLCNVSYRSVLVIYRSQYCSVLSLSLSLSLSTKQWRRSKKEMPVELTLQCFQMIWKITIQTPPMTVLVMQHMPHNDELCWCLSPISIECAASPILFIAYKFRSLLFPPHFKFILNYVDVTLNSSDVHCGPKHSRMSLLQFGMFACVSINFKTCF